MLPNATPENKGRLAKVLKFRGAAKLPVTFSIKEVTLVTKNVKKVTKSDFSLWEISDCEFR